LGRKKKIGKILFPCSLLKIVCKFTVFSVYW